MLPISLETVKLRALSPGDLPAFNAIYTDPAVRRYAEEPTVQPLRRIELLLKEKPIAVEALATGELIGWCALDRVPNIEPPTCEPEIFLAEKWQRQGIGGQILKELIAIAHDQGFTLQAKVHQRNSASRGMLATLGWSTRAVHDVWETWSPGALPETIP